MPKVYRFTTRSYFNERIFEPGETVVAADSVVPSPHMIDVAAESAAANGGPEYAPVSFPPPPEAVFRAELAHDPNAAAMNDGVSPVPIRPTFNPTLLHVGPVPHVVSTPREAFSQTPSVTPTAEVETTGVGASSPTSAPVTNNGSETPAG
jgi:hypothetical protein